MTEHSFVKRIHRRLDPRIKIWKIIDDFHGGVSDAAYFGTEGRILFVEYKFAQTLPVRPITIPSKLTLKPQQHLWLTELQVREVPAIAIFGVGYPDGGVWVTDEHEARYGLRKIEILDRLESVEDLAHRITTTVLGDYENGNREKAQEEG